MKITCHASGSGGNFYVLEGGKEKLFLEAGVSYKKLKNFVNFDFENVVGCLLSHEHKDHSYAIGKLADNGIDCYMSQGTSDALWIESHRIIIVKPEIGFRVGNEWNVIGLKTQHDCNEPLGYLVYNRVTKKKLLFITDTYYFRYKIPGLTHLMIEANYDFGILQDNIDKGIVYPTLKSRITRSHFEISNVKEFLRKNDKSKLEQVILIHISSNNGNPFAFKKSVEEVVDCSVHIATEGLII